MQSVKLTYRPARDNPLDLYVLMDLTWTMRDDKETLVKLGAELPEALHKLTHNYRLGFGSFADKPAMPMIMPQLQENPCAVARAVCAPTYGYRHHLSLTADVDAFVRSVNDSRITGNLDNLEGGLDALMQVLVCAERIGWKEEARKVVILVTDGFMHFAGDGLLAGITQRNDKQCHLSAEGEYLGSLLYDYPSLEEIYRELLRRKVNVIFAVTSAVVSTYHELSGLMKEISNVEILSADSSNILELIKKSYESFIKRVQFTDNSPSYIRLDYETDCGQIGGRKRRNFCNNIQLGKEIDFYVNITLTDYPADGVYLHKIRIDESSLNEHMEIEVEIQRPCPCTEQANPNDEFSRYHCYDNGYLQCGMCQCDVEGWAGIFCNCPTSGVNVSTNEAIENLCRKPSEIATESGPVCSNRGACDCGNCWCDIGYTGKYCECLECNADCDPARADCNCGRCVCKEGWIGAKCNCKLSDEECRGPTQDVCSGRGNCECSACVCDKPYLGKFCEIGLEKENKLCTFYEPCVTCLIEQKLGNGFCENLTEICSAAEEFEHFTHAFIDEEIDEEVRCLVRLENKGIKCDHYFTYNSLGKNNNYLLIYVRNDCEPPNYVAFVGYISLLTLVLGLLLIFICFWCLRQKDAREFARFNKEVSKAQLEESPIYKNPVYKYVVPKSLQSQNNENPFL